MHLSSAQVVEMLAFSCPKKKRTTTSARDKRRKKNLDRWTTTSGLVRAVPRSRSMRSPPGSPPTAPVPSALGRHSRRRARPFRQRPQSAAARLESPRTARTASTPGPTPGQFHEWSRVQAAAARVTAGVHRLPRPATPAAPVVPALAEAARAVEAEGAAGRAHQRLLRVPR